MAQTLDIFDLHFVTSAQRQIKTPKTFVSDKWFKAQTPILSQSEKIICDFWDEKRKLAPFMRIEDKAKVINKNPEDSKIFTPAYTSMKMQTKAEDLLKRTTGNPLFNTFTPEQLASQQMALDLLIMTNMITRLKEWMCCQLLTTGTVPIVGHGLNLTLDFNVKAAHKVTLTGGDRWNQGTAKIFDNIEDMERLIEDDAGSTMGDVLLGRNAARSFKADSEVQARLDNREFHVGRIETKKMPNGAKYIGTMEEIDFWSYNETYLDSSNVKQDYIGADLAIGIAKDLDAEMHFGMIPSARAGNVVSDFFSYSYLDDDPDARWLKTQSRPLPLLKETDGIVIYTVQ